MIIEKHIIHVLDKNSQMPILNDYEGSLTPELDAFYQKVIRKILRDDDLRKARFKDYDENEIRMCAEHILYDSDSFVLSSQAIATILFDAMKINAELDSCDLAIVKYIHKDEKGVAIIKLDYKKLYTHEIGYDESTNKVSIKMVTNEVAIQDSQKIIHAALIGINGANDEWHLEVLDKDAEKNHSDSSFVTEFIKSEKIYDEKYLTKLFVKVTDNWITNAYGNDVKKAEDVRSYLKYSVKEDSTINVDEFIEKNIDEDRREGYRELLNDRNISGEFPIDKTWVEKKLKRRSIKTNTGFDIKGLMEDFTDPMKYSISQNEDGSVNITIKNVEFYEEK